ncbi:adenylosuccinate lyase [Melioribacteraceae bacterium 4301-Me]|uniref:adenylosuccinate lyase n=1 Tax=Pyranulibacter aquaticus TaxID=3163344 RepID=UPI0035980E17
MIKRYTRTEMGKIWEEQFKYETWLKIELLACEARSKLGYIPEKDLEIIKSRAAFDIKRILEIEETTKHDVIAFLTNVAENVGPQSRYIHYGMTSSDILDTSLAYQMKTSGEILIDDLKKLKEVLKKKAIEHKYTICVGRTHGIHAEAITMGLKFALWYEETKRNIERLNNAIENISVGKLSGAVGTFEHLEPQVEEYVCKKLGLKPAPISTQIVQRDRHAHFMTTLAVIGSSLEKIATEVRHLQKTEVLECEEYFHAGQKGSSAMPHKRNPVISERIAGIARILRANSIAALENVSLWHERDISHSSVERVIIPDSCIILDYALNLITNLIDKLIIYPQNMLANLNLTRGLIHSQSVLLKLVDKGLTREEAYKIVQTAAMKVWEDKSKNLMDELLLSEEVKNYLSKTELEEIFESKKMLNNVNFIFSRTIDKD